MHTEKEKKRDEEKQEQKHVEKERKKEGEKEEKRERLTEKYEEKMKVRRGRQYCIKNSYQFNISFTLEKGRIINQSYCYFLDYQKSVLKPHLK